MAFPVYVFKKNTKKVPGTYRFIEKTQKKANDI